MKKIIIPVLIIVIAACSATRQNNVGVKASKPSGDESVRIANDSLEYEIIITDVGFDTWLKSIARPRGYYGLGYLENRNLFYVAEYNRRVLEPYRYNTNLYEMRIDYQSTTSYGYEVNYLLYNYFVFFQSEYKQKL